MLLYYTRLEGLARDNHVILLSPSEGKKYCKYDTKTLAQLAFLTGVNVIKLICF
jgi:hypothetical protein